MDWATSMVSPPYGDITQFLASCRRLLSENFDVFLPGHGGSVNNPSERLNFLINHREERERQLSPLKIYRFPQQKLQKLFTQILIIDLFQLPQEMFLLT